jgi:hypothetical protein
LFDMPTEKFNDTLHFFISDSKFTPFDRRIVIRIKKNRVRIKPPKFQMEILML